MNTPSQFPARQRTPQLLCTLASLAALLLAASPVATAVPPALNIAQKPLFLGGTDPNVLFVLDDSGSMNFAFMPEIIGKYALTNPNNSGSNCLGENAMPRRLTSAQYNTLYYDPAVTYLPPMNADGSTMANSNFAAAWTNGFKTSDGTTNLNNYKALFSPGTYTTPGTKCNYLDSTAKAAYYHVFNASNTGCTIDNAVSPPIPNDSCYTRVNVAAGEQENFANWFSYYRMRLLTAKTGVSRAFAQATSALYLGYGSINTSGMVARGVLPFKDGVPTTTSTSRSQFFNWLFAKSTSGSTPLRPALENAGKYYETQTAPWSSKPWDTANGNPVSCRQSYTILMTDGYWNGGSAVGNAKNDNDGTAGSTIAPAAGSSLSPYTYTPSAPFKDAASATRSDTLADVAMYYWKRDIRTDLANNVPVGLTSIDNAFWQHMTTFTIGLGFSSTVNKERAFNSITAKTGDADFGYPTSWPAPAADSENNIDDLLHAGVNGHGGFFSAKNPTEFANALGDTLSSIAARQVSAAAAAVNSGTLSADTVLYQATFNSNKWSGDVVAYKIDPSTQALTELAKASAGVPSPAGRTIYTWRPSYTSGASTIPAAAVTFVETNLSPTQTAAITSGISGASLGSTTVGDIVNYVRGDRSKELSNIGGTLRNRDGVIGDIINSDPAYARKMNLGYKYALGLSTAARSSYDAFVAAQIPTLYVGANDGMLHAFNGSKAAGDALDELFAFIPNSVIGNLPYLAKSTDFAHKYFVDGPTTVSHAYLNGRWKTILVGSTGAGGKAYFAIDVTTPSSPTVMWEFSDINNAAMGNTMSKAAVVHLANGKWAAVFGNGYNSTAQNASLFVLDLETGALIKKLDVTSRDLTLANGLSAPAISDLDGDGSGDLVYAGDLQGNLWKFNLSDSNPDNWAVSFGGKPLFQTPITTDVTGTHRQSITIKPELARHPQGGTLIMFGTGKFFEAGDQSNIDMQTFYGVRDECGFNTAAACTTVSTAKVTLSELLQQTFTGSTVRILSKNTDTTKKGYYVNLRLGTTNTGERVISNMLLLDDRIIFTSVIPNEDVCGFGGTSWLWELNLLTGGETPYSVFDLNNDGKFDASDRGNAVTLSGLARTPALVRDGSTGHLMTNENKPVKTNLYGEFGRQTWRKVR
ncbi:PilC/PilY family type IV pilus protein [Uliginosibacterium flavum]|uniref:PilC/PilY family type IV pilus protein n=1 Tax=Uliginosibacterium flavum TaxID=1396831 RepID=A0ABV2TLB0_9RHOO